MINVTVWLKDDSVGTDRYPHASCVTLDQAGVLRVFRDNGDDAAIAIAWYPNGTWLRAWTDGQKATDASYVPADESGDGDPTP